MDEQPRRRSSDIPLGTRMAVLERRFDDHIKAETESHEATLELIEKVEKARVEEHRDTMQVISELKKSDAVTEVRFARLYAAFAAVTSALALLLGAAKALGVIH